MRTSTTLALTLYKCKILQHIGDKKTMNKTVIEILETSLTIQGYILETIDLGLDETIDLENNICDIQDKIIELEEVL